MKSAILFVFGLNFSVVHIFCENQYFHDNDKQKSSKILKLKFRKIQISLWKANANVLNCGYGKQNIQEQKLLYVCFEVNRKNIFNLSFCIVIVNAPQNNERFNEMARKYR